MRKLFPFVIAVFTVLMVTAFSAGEEKKNGTEAGKAAFEEYCGKCHNLERTLTRPKSREEWEKTVDRMSGYHERFGGPIPGDSVKAIVDHLAEAAGK